MMRKAKLPLTVCAILMACLCAGAAEAVENPFNDVSEYDTYYDAVMWAYGSNVTSGVTADEFAPKATCNRGQVVTFLWRANGCPEPKTTSNPFTDVRNDSYCYKAVLWAVENGITNGTGATTFSPANPCTYAHVITFLWRANGQPHVDSEFSGSAWYDDAVAWANERGLLAGYSFNPVAPCPRVCIVVYLYRNQTGISEALWDMLDTLTAATIFEKTLEEAIEEEWDEEWLFLFFEHESDEATEMSGILDASVLDASLAEAVAQNWAEEWLYMYYHAFTDALSNGEWAGSWLDEGLDEEEDRHFSSIFSMQKGNVCGFHVYYRGGHEYVFRGTMENGAVDCIGVYIHRGALEETGIASQFRLEGNSLLWISEYGEEIRYDRAD